MKFEMFVSCPSGDVEWAAESVKSGIPWGCHCWERTFASCQCKDGI